jgi:hypothetical protein
MATVSISGSLGSNKIKDPERLFREWGERSRKLRSQFTYLATEYLLANLTGRIPSDPAYAIYRRGLEVVQVPVGADEDAFAVRVNPKAKRVTKLDGRRMLFYVRPRKRGRKTLPEIEVLASFSPWTLDTLPFRPSPKQASLISRKVAKREVLRVSEQLRRRRPEWSRALNELGVRGIRRDQDLVAPRGLEALPDIALDAVKLEFGLGTTKAKAHWRPALLWLQKRGLREMLKREKDLKSTLIKSEFQRWQKWPKRIKKIKASDAKSFIGFQKRLGIRVSK